MWYVLCFVNLVSELVEEAFFYTLDELNCDITVSAQCYDCIL